MLAEVEPDTPWGKPSDKIVISETIEGIKVAFLARHGRGHYLNPSEVPTRANIAALKHIGVQVIYAFSAGKIILSSSIHNTITAHFNSLQHQSSDTYIILSFSRLPPRRNRSTPFHRSLSNNRPHQRHPAINLL